jgi:hypothetical protein
MDKSMNWTMPRLPLAALAVAMAELLEAILPFSLTPRVLAHGEHGPRDATPALGLGGAAPAAGGTAPGPRPARVDRVTSEGAVFHTVSLAAVANAKLEQPDEWRDRIWKREMAQLPRGLQRFAGVPFAVIPPGENGGLAALTLVGGRYKEGPRGGGTVAVGRRAQSLYLLHTASYQNLNAGRLAATYAATYADGTRWEIPVRNKHEIADFLDNENLSDDCVVGWSTKHPIFPNHYGVYVARFVNPHPEKEIAAFEFAPSEGSAVVSVLGLTLGETTAPLARLPDVKSFARAAEVAGPRGRIEVSVQADGTPAAARATVVGSNGKPCLPPDPVTHMMFMRGVPFFYADGTAALDVPEGATTVTVARGFEYRPVKLSAEVQAGKTVRRTAKLERWIDLPAMGWYCGEMHIHPFDQEPADTALCLIAEDLHIANLLIWGNGFALRYHGDQFFRGKPENWPDAAHVAYYNEEFRNNIYGHLCLIDLRSLVYPMGTGSEYRIEDYPANAGILDMTHEQGAFASVAHMSVLPPAYAVPWEVGVDVALGKADSVDIDLKSPDRAKDRSLDLWYRLLNCGFPIPATTGTDAFMNSPWINHPLGNLRTYGYLGTRFSYRRWVDAARRGRSFVSQGPAVFLTVDGKMPGGTIRLKKGKNSLRIRAEARWMDALKRVEVVMNGRVVAALEGRPTSDTLVLDQSIEVDGGGSAWIAARAEGVTNEFFLHPALFAHTNPVYCSGAAPLRSPDDARFFISEIDGLTAWVETKGVFHDPAHREEVKALFGKARSIYERQAETQEASLRGAAGR